MMNKYGLIDLHLHLDGSLSLASVQELAEMQNIPVEQDDGKLLKLLQVGPDCKDLNEYLEKFSFPCSLLQRPEAITRAVENLRRELKDQGLLYAEIRYAPQLHLIQGLTQRQVVQAAVDGLKADGVRANLILCCMRGDRNHGENLETVRLAAEFLDKGVCAVDLAGAEALFPTGTFEEEFKLARELGVPCTIHAGEAAGPESVYTALSFGTKRLGHGIRSVEDPKLLKRLAEEGITLELCPTSNLNTNIFSSLEDYPLLRLMEAGVRVTINTDNTMVSGVSLESEWEKVIGTFHLTDDQILKLQKNAVEASFASPEVKKWLLAELDGRKRFRRIFTIVVDSLGVGAMPDAADYGDAGTDTLGHIAQKMDKFEIPNLQKLGLANLHPMERVAPVEKPLGYYAYLSEASNGKDTMTGHWEMMGLHITKSFKTFTETGFPKELIDELSARTGRVIIGNKSASGTEILEELAEEEIATGHMIVYTSADSVLQICGNEETFGLEELYRCCEIAREITMKPEWMVGRVIARPYVGKKKGEFRRTSNRHDYALKPYGPTALNALKDGGFDVISVGKIYDIFDGEGLTQSHKSKSSVHGMDQAIEIAKGDFRGLCYVNLVDFDALWGHRRNALGYGGELERFDEKLGQLLAVLREDDLLIITADHGNDPTHRGTDHTREKVPFLAYSPSLEGSGRLAPFDTFAVVGATIADNFDVAMPEGTIGNSLLDLLK